MLSYQDALSTIDQYAKPLGKVSVRLTEALGCTLAEPIQAKMPFPHFDNAAVDGFAVRFKVPHKRVILRPKAEESCEILRSAQDDMKFKYKGEIPAGHTRKLFLRPGEAMAIFTGAPTPQGTQAVVMQEYAARMNGSVVLQKPVQDFANIRSSGEDFKKGDALIAKGTCLEPQHLALLGALGHSHVKTVRRPKVAVLTTGSEIIKPGKKLQRGQIYDSNTPLLEALVKQTGAYPVLLRKVYDNLSGIRRAVRKGLQDDVLIVCGGVSVGKYDFVKEALRQEGVREIFWKIDIKPGKPVFFGKKGKTLVFGLPGNPVSVYVTFEEFVKPALLKMMGKKIESRWIEGAMQSAYQNGARPHFIRVQCVKREKGYHVTPLKGQGSHQIGTLAKANGILKVEARGILRRGQPVRVKVMSGAGI
jgi:molybdopterin molybdotransferase